jgi:hypothetical protein
MGKLLRREVRKLFREETLPEIAKR